MKISSIVLLLAIIGASLQQTAPAPSCSRTDTANNNRFALKWLEDKKVTIHSTPQTFTDTTVCAGEWKSKNTCCDLPTLKEFIQTENSRIVAKWKNYIAKITKFRNQLLPGVLKLVSKLTYADISNRWKIIDNVEALKTQLADARRAVPQDEKDTAFMKDWANKFEDYLRDFRQQGQKCFEMMRTARISAYCGICSGNANNYTEPQNNADKAVFKIPLDSCIEVGNTCFPVWQFNYMLTSVIQTINLLKLDRNPSTSAKIKFRNEVPLREIEGGTIFDAARGCTWANQKLMCGDLPATLQARATHLCTYGMVVNQINSLIEGDENTLDDMADSDSENASTDVSSETGGWRTLQTLSSSFKVEFLPFETTGYQSLNKQTGLEPKESVDTSKAGDSTTGANNAGLLVVSVSLFISLILIW